MPANTSKNCDKKFKSVKITKKHFTTQHTNKYQCATCGISFSFKLNQIPSRLKRHSTSHDQSKYCACKLCGKTFVRKKVSLKDHIEKNPTKQSDSIHGK